MNIRKRVRDAFAVGIHGESDDARRLMAENEQLRRELKESQDARKTLAEALMCWVFFGSYMTRSCLVDSVVPRIPELEELYAWFKEREVEVDDAEGHRKICVPRHGDEAELLKISPHVLDQASKIHGALHNRCGDLKEVESFLRCTSRALVELALRIYTERGDDRKSLIDARDAATVLALSIERYAAHISPGRWLRTPEDDEKSGQALVATFAGAAALLKDVMKHKWGETQEHVSFLPERTKAAFHRFLAEQLIQETSK